MSSAADCSPVVQVQSSHEGVHARAGFLRPLLRTVGNVAALGGRDACSKLLSSPVCKQSGLKRRHVLMLNCCRACLLVQQFCSVLFTSTMRAVMHTVVSRYMICLVCKVCSSHDDANVTKQPLQPITPKLQLLYNQRARHFQRVSKSQVLWSRAWHKSV